MNIGYIFDNPDLNKFFKLKGRYNFIEFTSSINIKNNTTKPVDFIYGKNKIDLIIVYIHSGKNKRNENLGLNWFLEFRMNGYITPVVLLTWFNCDRFQIDYLRKNPFIGVLCEDSCRILRLPVSLKKILNDSKELKPILKKILNIAAKDTLFFEINHKIKDNHSIEEIRNFLNNEIKYFKLNERYENILNDLLNLKSAKEISDYRDKLIIF